MPVFFNIFQLKTLYTSVEVISSTVQRPFKQEIESEIYRNALNRYQGHNVHHRNHVIEIQGNRQADNIHELTIRQTIRERAPV